MFCHSVIIDQKASPDLKRDKMYTISILANALEALQVTKGVGGVI